jgi:Flp pilus assembly protein TadG
MRCSRVANRQQRRERGSQIVELAVILPILLVFTAAAFDFGGVFTERDKIANSAREGARIGSQQEFLQLAQNGPGAAPTADVKAIGQTVFAYLQNAKVVRGCTLSAGSNTGPFAWTFTANSCPDSLTIKVERANPVLVNGTNTLTTRVTVTYPAHFLLFHRVITLAAPGANYASTFSIVAAATMQNVP